MIVLEHIVQHFHGINNGALNAEFHVEAALFAAQGATKHGALNLLRFHQFAPLRR